MPDFTPITQGDSPTFRFTVTNSAGDPFDLTDHAVEFWIKRSLQDDDTAAEYFGENAVIPYTEVDGIVDITIPATVTARLRVGRPYFWYLRVNHISTPTDIYIPERGVFLTTFPDVRDDTITRVVEL